MKMPVRRLNLIISSDPAEIIGGLSQGEILQSKLFSLFVADMEEFIRSRADFGISFNGLVDIALLLFFDDLIILAEHVKRYEQKM